MKMLGRREVRINRALSHVLEDIQQRHAYYLQFCEGWRDCYDLENETHALTMAAHDRADRAHATWDRIVSNWRE